MKWCWCLFYADLLAYDIAQLYARGKKIKGLFYHIFIELICLS